MKHKLDGLQIPVLQGILPVNGGKVVTDLVAGFTLAALAVPEVMGYTRIAGMPVVTGLYTLLVPMALFAVFGSSRHLVVGADSATAAILAGGLSGLAAAASPDYVAYAGLLALMAAAMLLIACLVRLSFLADFLSHTVLIGFLTGVGIQVMVSQISGILGLPGIGGGPVQMLVTDFRQLSQINPYSLGMALAVLGIIVGGRKLNRRFPGALVAVIGAILIGYLVDLPAYGVAEMGLIPAGLPKLAIPQIHIDRQVIGNLFPVAFSMFIVILAQSAATSRAYATRYHEHFNANLDLLGLGLANIGAGLTGTFVVNGSPTKTQMVDSAGGRSQLAQLTAAAIVWLLLTFLTGSLKYMPEVVLAAVVFLIGLELIDVKGMHRIFIERPVEFWVALITAGVVVFVGVGQGILLAILLSLIIHTRHGYKPKNTLLARGPDGDLRIAPLSSHAQVYPGLIVYRFHHSMYYANAEYMTLEVIDLVSCAVPPAIWFCVDATAVDDIDFTAAAALKSLFTMLQAKGIRLVLADLDQDVFRELERSGIVELLRPEAIFETTPDMLQAFRSFSANMARN